MDDRRLVDLASRFAVLALLAPIASGACSYSPHIEDGTLRCSTSGECPRGYTCRANLCYATAPGTDGGGSGGDAIPAAVLNRYVGDWAYAVGSHVTTQCNDGSPADDSPIDSTESISIAVPTSGAGDLVSAWLCTFPLRLDQSGAHLLGNGVDPNCTFVPTPGTGVPTRETWRGTQFDFVTTNGLTGTHVGGYTRVDQYSDHTVTCTQQVQATLTKL